MQRLSVLLPTPNGCYDYLSAQDLPVGQVVQIPFGRRTAWGVVWDSPIDPSIPDSRLKSILPIQDYPCLPKQTVKFVDWVAGYTLSPVGMVLKMAMVPDWDKASKKPLTFEDPSPRAGTVTFSEAQAAAIRELCQQREFSVTLLDGVTGSGKTEVYFEAIAKALEGSGQILVLLPEITLTGAWLSRFQARFGVKPAVWHSALTPKQRRDTWQAVLNGQARVVVGARSALFLPFQKLDLIVVDEEHDPSYKQEEGILYQARDMAVVRAKIANAPVILASATPSVETVCNVREGRYRHVILPERFSGAVFPEIRIADMRRRDKGSQTFISEELKRLIAEKYQAGEQILLFLNRRGYAPLNLCRACGHRIQCPHCAGWLVEHRQKGRLMCHHCGYTRPIPTVCPACGEKDSLVSCGPGVERIQEEVQRFFPNARSVVITSETMADPEQFAELTRQVLNNEVDILIGTQILAKGHNFPNLTLVGVIDADMGLAGGDLRAGERTFQLLHQVMGRAGRAQKQGLAILQSYNPDNLIIQALQKNDRSAFLNEEIETRRALSMPPFGRLAGLIVSAANQTEAYRVAGDLAKTAPADKGVTVLGPVPAPIPLLREKYRFRLLVRADKQVRLQNIIRHWLARQKIPAKVDVRLDIDPYSFF